MGMLLERLWWAASCPPKSASEPTKVGERVEAVGVVEPFLIFSVAALDLAIVAGRIRANQLMAEAQVGGSGLEERLAAAVLDGEAVGELGAVVGLDTLDLDAVAGIPGDRFLQEVGGRIGAVLLVGTQISQAGELVDGGILEQLQAWIGDTATWYDLYIDLYTLARTRHLLVRFGNVFPLFLRRREHAETVQHPV